MYADDLKVYYVGPELQILCDRINMYVPTLLQFFKERDLIVSPREINSILFIPTTKSSSWAFTDLDKWYNCPLEKRARILGVIHDITYTFIPHCRIQAAKVRARNNLLKALAGTSWGQQKETLILTYKALDRSVIDGRPRCSSLGASNQRYHVEIPSDCTEWDTWHCNWLSQNIT